MMKKSWFWALRLNLVNENENMKTEKKKNEWNKTGSKINLKKHKFTVAYRFGCSINFISYNVRIFKSFLKHKMSTWSTWFKAWPL